MPVQHSQLLETVPSLGMQFANDCEWLAKRVRSLRKGERPEQTGKRLEKLAKVTRERQVDIQKAALAECLADAEGFRDTGDAARFAACERAIKQVKHTLERVSQAWKVLPRDWHAPRPSLTIATARHAAVGVLDLARRPRLDSARSNFGRHRVAGRHWRGRVAEAQRLVQVTPWTRLALQGGRNGTCLTSCSSLDLMGYQSTIGRHVPEWFKYCFLSELLEASMAVSQLLDHGICWLRRFAQDIMWMHGEGLLSEYSDREVVNLIQALFSESPLRTKNIDKILAAGARGT